MPVAKKDGFFFTEKPLNVGNIADILAVKAGKADIDFVHYREIRGIALVEVVGKVDAETKKKQKIEFRAVVLGEAEDNPGTMVLYHRPGQIYRTAYGLELARTGRVDVGNIHWSSGLQLKWVPKTTPGTKSESGIYGEREIQNARVELAKDLVIKLEENADWKKLPWKDIKNRINGVQRQLDPALSPKKRQQSRHKKATRATKANNVRKTNKARKARKLAGQVSKVVVENWKDAKHVVTSCKPNVAETGKFSDEEKEEVVQLMDRYTHDDVSDLDQDLHKSLAELLNKGFVAPFNINILETFAEAKAVNKKLYRLGNFASFADWWTNRNNKRYQHVAPSVSAAPADSDAESASDSENASDSGIASDAEHASEADNASDSGVSSDGESTSGGKSESVNNPDPSNRYHYLDAEFHVDEEDVAPGQILLWSLRRMLAACLQRPLERN